MAAHEHLIDLMPDFGWALHHHNECVGALDACPVTIAVRKADTFPDHMPGTYACHVNAVGEVELRTVAPRLTEREIEARHDKQAARVAELEAIVGSVQHYGYAYEVSNPRTGAKQLLDPRDVTVFLPRERADEFLASWERRALRAEARVAELERQRDAVVALHKRWHLGGTAYICHEDDESWPCNTVEIYGGGE